MKWNSIARRRKMWKTMCVWTHEHNILVEWHICHIYMDCVSFGFICVNAIKYFYLVTDVGVETTPTTTL